MHLVRVSTWRRRVLTLQLATRLRELARPVLVEKEIAIRTGKIASDHVHLFIADWLAQTRSTSVLWLKGIGSRLLLSAFVQPKRHLRGAWLRVDRLRQHRRRVGPARRRRPGWRGRRGGLVNCNRLLRHPVPHGWGSFSVLNWALPVSCSLERIENQAT